MKILSIETSGTLCGVALSENENIISVYSKENGNIHDEFCAQLIKSALIENSLSVNDLDAVAVSSGPGSFTGLRIGASIAKALCFKENHDEYAPRLIAVPTLSAFAIASLKYAASLNCNTIIAALPAQKDVLYYRQFDLAGKAMNEIETINRNDFEKLDMNNIFLCGAYFKNSKEQNSVSHLNVYSVEIIANLATKMYNENIFTDPAKFKPDYIQDFIIKTKRKSLNI